MASSAISEFLESEKDGSESKSKKRKSVEDPLLKACVKSASSSTDGIVDQLALTAALNAGYSKHFITEVVVPLVPQQPEKINNVHGSTNLKRPFSELESDSVKRPRPGLGMGLMSIPKDHTCSGCYCSECDRIDNAAIDFEAEVEIEAKKKAYAEELNAFLATRSQYRSSGPARGRRYLA